MVGKEEVTNMFKTKFPSLSSLVSDGNTSFLRAARAGHLDKVLDQLDKNNVDINTSNANGLNALHLASKDGHVHVVTELLKRGANVDSATKKGNTALHIASLAGQEEVVRLLVEHGASVNVQSQNGFTPLYMAAQENHDCVVRYLLSNGANQSLATEDGFTPLAVAMQQGHDKVVAVLLESDTRGKVRLPALHIAAKKDDCKAAALLLQNEHNPDVTSKSGFTPLHIASHYGNEGIANLLLGKGADVNYSAKHNITPLHVAAKWGKSNMVSLLLERGAHIESKTRDGLTPLHCAARSGHEQVVDMLLERGAPISSKTKNGLAPLHMSSQGDHVDAARILLYHRAPVDEVTVDYLTALHVAAHCGHARVAKLLLDRKADPNARALNGFTPLHIACKKNRIKVVELLLKHGASIEATTESGLTPLHVASFMGCMNIVIYLLQNEASPDVPTVRGETPLHLAARANQTDIIRILLRNGAQVDARAREQQTPLHIASRLGNVDIVMLLLQHGAAVDCATKDLYSALHIAAKEGQDEVAGVLLENGASLSATTKKGFTPLHLAAKYGNMKVARLLLQRDAPVDAQGKNGVTALHVASHYDHQNVALLLLDKGASPHATAKNGHTPLHIAAKKNQMDIATTLLEYGAKSSAESKAGFTPLHLSAQEGHTDMSSVLIDHHADTNHKAKNGLTPLHLCAQEDRVNVASVLVKNGAEVDATTKAGYTPLHVASHFGQLNMVRFLVGEGAEVGAQTAVGYTPLHQAAQQGHSAVVHVLLDKGAPPNHTTSQGQTAMSIAQKLGYISVVETLKGVTDQTTITPPASDEKYKAVSPETMQETFMSDSEDEGGEDTLLSEQPYRYLTVDEMKSLGDDSLPIDVRQDERIDSNRECMSVPPTAVDDTISPLHHKEAYSQFTTPDNIDINKHPLHVGFLVSFLVDARGGAMRGCRHSGVRMIVPPRRAAQPMRVTCRYLKRDKLPHPPPLMEGEALASRILELGPVGAKFLGPVMIEVPHFGSLRGKEREIVILRSDNGETWREHTVDNGDDAVQDVLSHSFDKEADLAPLDENARSTRILTTDFPHYFAVITRVRQEVHAIGPEGGMVSSSVVPQVQAVFPQGALTKKIKVGLQAQPIPAELAAKLLGNRVAVSPIVTVEPRRRKFHKPITLTIPKPQAASKGMINNYSGDAPTLRLLCSITGGTTRAQWEDVTGSTPFTFVNDCVSFTTTVSARFWLMDCRNVGDATKMATELYREAIHVPFMAKFVVFAKRVDPMEARLRIFCMTDDKEDKTLEHQEHFTEVAKSRDVEVLEGKTQYVEFAGNLVPVTKSGEQLQLGFRAFRENRLPFTVRVKDPHADSVGRTLFMMEARLPKGEPPQQPICVLNIVLPDEIIPEAILPDHELHKYSYIQDPSGLESYQRVDLRLSDVSNLLGGDWVALASELGVSQSDINRIKSEQPQSDAHQGLAMLRLWLASAGNKAQASTLENALSQIGRDDIVQQCVFNIEPTSLQKLKDESQDASIRRNIPYSEKDIIKNSDNIEGFSRIALRKTSGMIDKDDKEERKYEAEEKEVDDVNKSVLERRKEIEKRLSLDVKSQKTVEKVTIELSEDVSEKETAEEKQVSSPDEEPSEMSFHQKRLSFEQGKRVIEMKPDKVTIREVKVQADERFLAEERRVAEAAEEKKAAVDETSIPFEEKRKSFEQGVREEKKKEEVRRDSALFEGVSQGLVRLDAAFAVAPQVPDLLSPKTSKTPPPSPAEFKDITGTVAWTEETTSSVPARPDQSQDWAEEGKPDSTLDPSSKGSTTLETSPKSVEIRKENISVTSNDSEKESKYQFTMSVPDKQTFTESVNSIQSFLDAEKNYNDQTIKTKPDNLATLAYTDMTSSSETEESQSRSESEPKSDKSFVGKMSKRLFGVFKKDDRDKGESKKAKKKRNKKENTDEKYPAYEKTENTESVERDEVSNEAKKTINESKDTTDSAIKSVKFNAEEQATKEKTPEKRVVEAASDINVDNEAKAVKENKNILQQKADNIDGTHSIKVDAVVLDTVSSKETAGAPDARLSTTKNYVLPNLSEATDVSFTEPDEDIIHDNTSTNKNIENKLQLLNNKPVNFTPDLKKDNDNANAAIAEDGSIILIDTDKVTTITTTKSVHNEKNESETLIIVDISQVKNPLQDNRMAAESNIASVVGTTSKDKDTEELLKIKSSAKKILTNELKIDTPENLVIKDDIITIKEESRDGHTNSIKNETAENTTKSKKEKSKSFFGSFFNKSSDASNEEQPQTLDIGSDKLSTDKPVVVKEPLVDDDKYNEKDNGAKSSVKSTERISIHIEEDISRNSNEGNKENIAQIFSSGSVPSHQSSALESGNNIASNTDVIEKTTTTQKEVGRKSDEKINDSEVNVKTPKEKSKSFFSGLFSKSEDVASKEKTKDSVSTVPAKTTEIVNEGSVIDIEECKNDTSYASQLFDIIKPAKGKGESTNDADFKNTFIESQNDVSEQTKALRVFLHGPVKDDATIEGTSSEDKPLNSLKGVSRDVANEVEKVEADIIVAIEKPAAIADQINLNNIKQSTVASDLVEEISNNFTNLSNYKTNGGSGNKNITTIVYQDSVKTSNDEAKSFLGSILKKSDNGNVDGRLQAANASKFVDEIDDGATIKAKSEVVEINLFKSEDTKEQTQPDAKVTSDENIKGKTIDVSYSSDIARGIKHEILDKTTPILESSIISDRKIPLKLIEKSFDPLESDNTKSLKTMIFEPEQRGKSCQNDEDRLEVTEVKSAVTNIKEESDTLIGDMLNKAGIDNTDTNVSSVSTSLLQSAEETTTKSSEIVKDLQDELVTKTSQVGRVVTEKAEQSLQLDKIEVEQSANDLGLKTKSIADNGIGKVVEASQGSASQLGKNNQSISKTISALNDHTLSKSQDIISKVEEINDNVESIVSKLNSSLNEEKFQKVSDDKISSDELTNETETKSKSILEVCPMPNETESIGSSNIIESLSDIISEKGERVLLEDSTRKAVDDEIAVKDKLEVIPHGMDYEEYTSTHVGNSENEILKVLDEETVSNPGGVLKPEDRSDQYEKAHQSKETNLCLLDEISGSTNVINASKVIEDKGYIVHTDSKTMGNTLHAEQLLSTDKNNEVNAPFFNEQSTSVSSSTTYDRGNQVKLGDETMKRSRTDVGENVQNDKKTSDDDKLNSILIDMLIEQECLKSSAEDKLSSTSQSPDLATLREKHDTEESEKITKSLNVGFKTTASFGKVESLISDGDLKGIDDATESGQCPYVTTPTMQRRKIGGSQRLSREERPAMREVTHVTDYSSSEEDETNYIVTEPSERQVTFQVESEDESLCKVSDSGSELELEVTEMTPSPVPTLKKQECTSDERIEERLKPKTKDDKNVKKVERRFERMASETLDADPVVKFTADRDFQRMVSQLSSEEVDACLSQWDEGGLTPSEELDSTRDTVEGDGDLDPDIEALPEAHTPTNPFYPEISQWADFEQQMRKGPSSIFWAFDSAPTSAEIQPSELDIPIKSVRGDSTEEASKSPVQSAAREGEEALLDLAAGLQETKGSGAGSGPSGAK